MSTKSSLGKEKSLNEISQSRRSSQGIALAEGSGSGPLTAAAGGSDHHIDSDKKKSGRKSHKKHSVPNKKSSKKLKRKKTQTKASLSYSHHDEETKRASDSEETKKRSSSDGTKRLSFSNDIEGEPAVSRKRSSVKDAEESRRQISVAADALNHQSSILKRRSEEHAEGVALKVSQDKANAAAGKHGQNSSKKNRKNTSKKNSRDLATETSSPSVEDKGMLTNDGNKDLDACVCPNECVCVDEEASGEKVVGKDAELCLCPNECVCVDEDKDAAGEQVPGKETMIEVSKDRKTIDEQLISMTEQPAAERKGTVTENEKLPTERKPTIPENEQLPFERKPTIPENESLPFERKQTIPENEQLAAETQVEPGDIPGRRVSSQSFTVEEDIKDKTLSAEKVFSSEKFPRSPEMSTNPENGRFSQEIQVANDSLVNLDQNQRKSGEADNGKLSIESPVAPPASSALPNEPPKPPSIPTMDRKSFGKSSNPTIQTAVQEELNKQAENNGEQQPKPEPGMFDTSTCETLELSAGNCCDTENFVKVLQSALPPHCKVGEMIILENTPTIDLEQEVDRLVAVAKHHCTKEKNAIRRRYEEEMKNLKNQYEDEMRRMKRKMEDDFERLKGNFENEIRALQEKLLEESRRKGDSQQKLAEYEEEIRRLNQALADRPTKEAMESLQKKLQELEALLAAAKGLEDENQELKHELEKLMKILEEHGLLKDQMMEHEGEIARLHDLMKSMALEHESNLDMAQSEIINKCEEEKAKLLKRIQELEAVEEENRLLKEDIQKQKDLLAEAQAGAAELEASLRKQMEDISEECKKRPEDEVVEEAKRESEHHEPPPRFSQPAKPSIVNFIATETTTRKSYGVSRQSELPEGLTRAGAPSNTASFASPTHSHAPPLWHEYMNEEVTMRESTQSIVECDPHHHHYEEPRPRVKDEAVNCKTDCDPYASVRYPCYPQPNEGALMSFHPCPHPPMDVCRDVCQDVLRQKCDVRSVLVGETEKESVRCIGKELLMMGRRILEEIDLAESFRQPCGRPDKYEERSERVGQSVRDRAVKKSDDEGNHATSHPHSRKGSKGSDS